MIKPHFLVKVVDVVERTFEVWADDEEQAERVALKGLSEYCVEHEHELHPSQVVEIETVMRCFQC